MLTTAQRRTGYARQAGVAGPDGYTLTPAQRRRATAKTRHHGATAARLATSAARQANAPARAARVEDLARRFFGVRFTARGTTVSSRPVADGPVIGAAPEMPWSKPDATPLADMREMHEKARRAQHYGD